MQTFDRTAEPTLFWSEDEAWDVANTLATINPYAASKGYDAAFIRAHMQTTADGSRDCSYVSTLGYALTLFRGEVDVWDEETGAPLGVELRRTARVSLSPFTVSRFLRSVATA